MTPKLQTVELKIQEEAEIRSVDKP